MAMRIAGSARKDGITYYGEHYIASVTVRDGQEPVVQVKERKLKQTGQNGKLAGLPGIRGLISLFGNNPEMAVLIGVEFARDLTDEDSKAYLALEAADLGLAAAVIYRHYGDIGSVRRFHGAEHKTVGAVDRNLPVDQEHVRKISRVHPRCGTNFAGFYLCSTLLTSLLPIRSETARALIAVGLAYEGFRLDPVKYRKYVGRFYQFGSWLQAHVTTAEPGEVELEAGILAVNALLEAEKQYAEKTSAHPDARACPG